MITPLDLTRSAKAISFSKSQVSTCGRSLQLYPQSWSNWPARDRDRTMVVTPNHVKRQTGGEYCSDILACADDSTCPELAGGSVVRHQTLCLTPRWRRCTQTCANPPPQQVVQRPALHCHVAVALGSRGTHDRHILIYSHPPMSHANMCTPHINKHITRHALPADARTPSHFEEACVCPRE